jgi:hypothetical protein
VRRVARPRFTFDDSGQMAGMEAIPFGLLILVVGALLVANAWAVVDAKLAVTAAAREAVRAFVEAPSEEAAHRLATTAARDSIAGHGHDPAALRLTIRTGSGFGRCSEVTIDAEMRVPSVTLPFSRGFGRDFAVRATHTEVVDPYRSGLAGEAICG